MIHIPMGIRHRFNSSIQILLVKKKNSKVQFYVNSFFFLLNILDVNKNKKKKKTKSPPRRIVYLVCFTRTCDRIDLGVTIMILLLINKSFEKLVI